MNIKELKAFSFSEDGEIRPWVDPASVTGLNYEASKAFYKEQWRKSRSGALYSGNTTENNTTKLHDYISECASWWCNLKEDGCAIPEALCGVNPIALVKADIFFLRYLGYYYPGWICDTAKRHSDITMNKEIFVLYKTAFEEESEPYIKYCLQENFLEFFGYIPVFDEGSGRNWEGLSEEELQYLRHLHRHRLLVDFY
jgi:hypothetical protein